MRDPQGRTRWRSPFLGWGLLLAGALALRLAGLTSESLWYDEAWSVAIAREPLGWIATLRVPGWPWPLPYTGSGGGLLYHFVLHFWLALGQDPFTVRLLSALLGVAGVALAVLLGRDLFGGRAGWATGFLVAASPLQVWYGQEARMYALFSCLMLAAAWGLWHTCHGGQRWAWGLLVAALVLGTYTHSFGWFAVVAANLFWLWQRLTLKEARPSWRAWAAAQGVVLGLSLPGLAGFLGQASMGWWSWIGRTYGAPGLRDLASVLAAFVTGPVNPFSGPAALAYTLAALAVGLGTALLGFGWAWRAGRREEAALAATLAVVPVGGAFLLAQWRPLFLLRYLVAFQPFCLLLAAARVGVLAGKVWRNLPAALLVTLFVPGLVGMYAWEQKEDWRGVAALLEAEGRPGDRIVLVDEDIRAPLNYYYHGGLLQTGVSRFQTDPEALATLVERWAQDGGRVWLVMSHHDTDALEGAFRASAQWREDLRADFRGVKVRRFVKEGG
ncbi:MAG: glycosyltransferase family 39 protein [Anaerolineae bacterium]